MSNLKTLALLWGHSVLYLQFSIRMIFQVLTGNCKKQFIVNLKTSFWFDVVPCILTSFRLSLVKLLWPPMNFWGLFICSSVSWTISKKIKCVVLKSPNKRMLEYSFSNEVSYACAVLSNSTNCLWFNSDLPSLLKRSRMLRNNH